MAVFTLTNVGIFADGINLSGFANKIDGPDISVETKDFTTFGSVGWKYMLPGLASHTWQIDGFQNYAVGSVDTNIGFSNIGTTTDTFTLAPTGGLSVGDIAYLGQGWHSHLNALQGAVGDPAGLSGTWTGTGKVVEGIMIHPQAARTVTGTGTAVAYVPPSATQSLYASFHVLAVSGAGSIVFTVKTAALIGMASPTTRITSSALTAVGSEFDSTAAGAITDGFCQISWTITGFTSVTFAASLGSF